MTVILYMSYSNSGRLSLTSWTKTSTLAVADRVGLSSCVACKYFLKKRDTSFDVKSDTCHDVLWTK